MKKLLWLALSFSVVLSLVLTSCAETPTTPTVPTTPTTPTSPTTPTAPNTPTAPTTQGKEMVRDSLGRMVEKPKYGGEANIAHPTGYLNFDDAIVSGTVSDPTHLTHEQLLTGDWKKSPTGSGETDWYGSGFYLPFATGALAESWEVPEPRTLIFHIRKGVRFQNKPPVNGRELTADDVAFSIKRQFTLPTAYGKQSYGGWFVSVEAPDKYTVIVKNLDSEETRTGIVFSIVADHTNIYPRDAVEKYGDMTRWENSCGTGPFMITDFVNQSSATFARNPNYWMKDPLHPGNQLPYLDTVKFLTITDPSTRLAALMTSKIDWLDGINLDDKTVLAGKRPDLQYVKKLLGNEECFFYRLDKPDLPFKNLKVRKALQMAIDLTTIRDQYYRGEAEILAFQMPPVPEYIQAYTPLDQLPPDVRENFTYNPEKAKQLLAEAGFPNGFTTSVVCYKDQVDLVSIVKDYWAKIGVKLNLDVKEYGVYSSIRTGRSAPEMIFFAASTGTADKLQQWKPGHLYNQSYVNDQFINQKRSEAWLWENFLDTKKQQAILKEANVYALGQVWEIQTGMPYVYTFWQPWIKSYKGESSVGLASKYNFPAYIWLDQDLKQEMIGKGR